MLDVGQSVIRHTGDRRRLGVPAAASRAAGAPGVPLPALRSHTRAAGGSGRRLSAGLGNTPRRLGRRRAPVAPADPAAANVR